MTEEERQLDVASKHSSRAVLGVAAVAVVALFGPPFFFPLTAIPLVALGILQRFTERPWLGLGAVAYGAGLAAFTGSPLLGAASAVGAIFAGRHAWSFRAINKQRALPPS